MGRFDLQATEGENSHQACFLASGQVQAFEVGHGEAEDDEVGEDVDGGVAEPFCREVHAVVLWIGCLVPEVVGGEAEEDGSDDRPRSCKTSVFFAHTGHLSDDTVAAYENHHCDDEAVDEPAFEKSHVLQQD